MLLLLSALVRRKLPTGVKIKNDISIALLFELGELKIFLAGDIMNSTIGYFESYHFEKLTYLKTPHHTSATSDKLFEIFDKEFNGYKIPISCTTGFQTHELPDIEMVHRYKDYSDSFYSTYQKNHPSSFGIIEVEFNPFDLSSRQTCYGSAQQLF